MARAVMRGLIEAFAADEIVGKEGAAAAGCLDPHIEQRLFEPAAGAPVASSDDRESRAVTVANDL